MILEVRGFLNDGRVCKGNTHHGLARANGAVEVQALWYVGRDSHGPFELDHSRRIMLLRPGSEEPTELQERKKRKCSESQPGGRQRSTREGKLTKPPPAEEL